MSRVFVVRQVLFEVENVTSSNGGKDVSRYVAVGIGPQIEEGINIVRPFRLVDWTPMRVGDIFIPCKEYRPGMLVGATIEGERKP